jgi:polysaccharide biosynthesis/export protein ExoF
VFSCFFRAESKSSFLLRNFAAAFLLAAASQLPAGWDRPAYAGSGTAATEAAITPSPSTGSRYKIGDQLKITFFEKLDVDADTDADRQRSDRSFHQRMDISGDYMVDEKGTISIPLLGSVEVAGKDEKAVTEALARPFESLIGRVGFINIVVKEQQPIYIIGPVKTPGVYKYSPGLTVLHAVALAGGFDSGVSDIWHLVEAVRETQTNQTSLDRLKRLLAREAVLRAERDGGEVAVPGRLIDLTSESVAKSLVDSEKSRRESEIQLQQTREKTLAKNIDNLKKSIEIRRGRVGFIGDSVDARTSRLNNLRGLQNRGSVTNYVVVQAQSDLADTQDRRQDMLVSISDAEASLDQAKQQQAEFGKDARQKLDGELTTIGDEISVLTKTLASGVGLSKTMTKIAAANELTAGKQDTKIEIIRRTPTGNTVTRAEPTTPLEAGDLVRISLPDATQ